MLLFSYPIALPCRQEVGNCKVCLRQPATNEAALANPGNCSLDAKWVPEPLLNGTSGECNDLNCQYRNCKWLGQIQVTNHSGSPLKVNIKWGGIILGGGTKTIGNGETVAVDLRKEIPCKASGDQTVPVTVTFPNGGCSSPMFLNFVCRKCK